MKKKFIYTTLLTLFLSGLFFPSCSDLLEEPRDKVTSEVLINDPNLVPNLVAPALGQLRGLWMRESVWGMQEASSDELFFPTRGTDWFDGGVWQMQYLHTWTTNHRDVIALWDQLGRGIASANFGIGVLGDDEGVSDEIKGYRGMLRFLRDFYMYNLIDLYGLSPYRDAASTDYTSFPEIMDRETAFYFIVSDLKRILNDLPEKVDADYGVPNRDAGRMLLAKLYINKEVYTGTAAYDSALIYLNQIIDPGNYNLANDYFGMFGANNHENHMKADDEAIFVAALDDGDDYGLDNRVIWIQHTLHYRQNLSGDFTGNWNGCSAPEGYLNDIWVNGTDTATDVRWKDTSYFADMAINAGFIYGQQYDIDGEIITDRQGDPLNFTFECSLQDAEEAQGVRVVKYMPRVVPVNPQRTPNDFLIYRYADALLMKAECLARDGDLTGALDIVNQIRTKRNAPVLDAGNFELIDILDERGRELYWEGHRRQDMIRFGTFLDPKTSKDFTSPETAKLLPIPQTAIESMEGRLDQNPGY